VWAINPWLPSSRNRIRTDDVDRAQAILEISEHGKQQQRLGDMAHQAGQNEVADTCYARAKIAREKGLLLHGFREAADPDYCYSVQKLLTAADLYGLVQWELSQRDEDD
jgi:hypothetical protein